MGLGSARALACWQRRLAIANFVLISTLSFAADPQPAKKTTGQKEAAWQRDVVRMVQPEYPRDAQLTL